MSVINCKKTIGKGPQSPEAIAMRRIMRETDPQRLGTITLWEVGGRVCSVDSTNIFRPRRDLCACVGAITGSCVDLAVAADGRRRAGRGVC